VNIKHNHQDDASTMNSVPSLVGPSDAPTMAGDGADSRWVIARRSFLQATGFTLAGTSLATLGLLSGCAPAPVRRALPGIAGVPEQTPGIAQWYATVCGGCPAGCGALAKVRDGRPIKLEGLPGHPLSRGGLCAIGQAHLLELYDGHRLQDPQLAQKTVTWATLDSRITSELAGLRTGSGAVRILASGLTSPTLRATITRFLAGFTDGKLVEYDPVSVSAIRAAHQTTHGAPLLPTYRFERAQVVASFDADFLGTWLSPVAFTAGWKQRRRLEAASPQSSQIVQIESRMSLTGSKADSRIVVHPNEIPVVLGRLTHFVSRLAGALPTGLPSVSHALDAQWRELAGLLWKHRGESLVVCGNNDLASQLAVNALNQMLANYGASVDIAQPCLAYNGSDAALLTLTQELERGDIAALILVDANPVYELPAIAPWKSLLAQVPLTISFAPYADETASLCRVVAPDHHPLEGWGDAEVQVGLIAIRQPAINPLYRTRSVLSSLQAWMGTPADDQATIRQYWTAHVQPYAAPLQNADTFWHSALATGFVKASATAPTPGSFFWPSMAGLGSKVSTELTLVCVPSNAVGSGKHALNPWLQELPDPLTKVTWDNVLTLSPAAAAAQGIQDGDVVRIDGAGDPITLPALIQRGQHDEVVTVSLGYGRAGTERFSAVGPRWIERREWQDGAVGRNVATAIAAIDGRLQYSRNGIRITRTGAKHPLAKTQQQDQLETPRPWLPAGSAMRNHVQSTTLAQLPAFAEHLHGEHHPEGDMWPPDHANAEPQWGMVIDLSACTGCSGCVMACQAENNIPVVGKDEVMRGREMHWLRIDRYYSGEGEATQVAHQPMLCAQCGNAPCETVCPVLATVHSEDGLNQQVYNRCVGTRYCANNCPYKVRRFNWFDYPHQDPIENLVLNPDVTIRTRGVMEKCTFCVQRIAEARIRAKVEGRPLADGDIQPACQQSCPAQAITFGNLADPQSAVSRAREAQRGYQVLAELNIKPSITYQAIVRHPIGEAGGQHG